MDNRRSPRTVSLAALIGLLLTLAACTPPQPAAATATPPLAPTHTPQPPNLDPTATALPTQSGARFPDPAGYEWLAVTDGLDQPVDIQNAADGSGRLFLVEKTGRIRILQGGVLLPEPFLDISERVGDQGLEQGLLGLAFHPGYESNGLFFVNYTDRLGNTVIARFQVLAGESNRADPGSETQLLYIEQPYSNHNGGGLAFGPDGYLYIGLGDGGAAGDPHENARDPFSLLGKMLRIDVDHGSLYAIPPENPFAAAAGTGHPEIWRSGLRNPWRFAFDPANGDLYIGDVGQDQWEEVNYLAVNDDSGLLDFGWDRFEGSHPYENPPPAGGTILPVAEYAHRDGRCSVTGGLVYRGQALAEWSGAYFFADYCTGEVFGLLRTAEYAWEMIPLFATGFQVSTFGADEVGELHLADFRSGVVYRLSRR
ncbi:MAG: PQQ-dependent sugar dehydrogenase [Chloroflexi bacterium]|nr:PQQ-dependent sugar dehydrogenase [Chloroflexota bacterium]